MKNKKLLFIVPLVALLLAGCGRKEVPSTTSGTNPSSSSTSVTPTTSGSSSTSEQPDVLVSISIEGDMTKKEYDLGDQWDKTGLTFKGVYSKKGEVVISPTVTFDPATANDINLTSVKVKASFSGKEAEKTITGIKVNDVAKSSLQIAYEAAAELSKGSTTSEAYTFSGVVSAMNGRQFFVQDGGYGMYCFATTTYEDVAIGKEVTVTATLKNYSGCLETASISSVVVGKDGVIPEAVEVKSFAELQVLKQNIRVNLVASMPDSLAGKTWSSTATPIVDTKLGDDDLKIKFDKNGYSEERGAIYEDSEKGKLSFTGIITTAYDYDAGSPLVNQCLVVGSTELELVEDPVTSIVIKTQPTKLEYASGEYFDPTGLEITASLESGVSKDYAYEGHEDDFSFNPSLTTPLTQSGNMSVTFRGKSADVAYTVVAKYVTGIAIKTAPSKLSYYAGEYFDPTGLEITVTYSEGDPADVAYAGHESDFTFVPDLTTALTASDKNVSIQYLGYDQMKMNQAITVIEDTRTSMQKAYEAAALLAKGKSTEVEYTYSGVVTGIRGTNAPESYPIDLFVQDGDYGMYIYQVSQEVAGAATGLAVGKEVTVTSILSNYNGCLEGASCSAITVNKDGTLPKAVKITSLADLNALKQNVLVDCTYSLPSNASAWSSSSSPRPSGKVGSDTISCTFAKGAYSAANGAIYDASKGSDMDIAGAYSTAYSGTGETTSNQLMISANTVLSQPVATSITCSSDKDLIGFSETATLSAELNGSYSGNISYEIVTGESLASISGNILTAGSTAGTVEVVAKCDNPVLTSDSISIEIANATIVTKKSTLTAKLGDAIAAVGGTATGSLKYDEEATDSLDWTRTCEFIAADKKDYSGFTNGYAQFGSANALEKLVIVTKVSMSNVNKVEIDCGSKDSRSKVTVSVGGTQLGSTQSAPNEKGLITFSGTALTGIVEITFEVELKTSGCAQYLKSVAITTVN